MKNDNFIFLTDEEILGRALAVDYPIKEIINCAVNSIGDVATMNEVCNFFKISRNKVYTGINRRKILTAKSGAKLLIITKTVANILNNNEV